MPEKSKEHIGSARENLRQNERDIHGAAEKAIDARHDRLKDFAELGEMAAEHSSAPEQEDFDPENLADPQGVEIELNKFNCRSGLIRQEVGQLSEELNKFQNAFQRFEEDKKGWDVFLRGIKATFGDDPQAARMESALRTLQSKLEERMEMMKREKQKIADYGARLNQRCDELKTEKREERDGKLKEIDAQGTEIERRQKKDGQKYAVLQEKQRQMEGARDQLADYRFSLVERIDEVSAAAQTGIERRAHAEELSDVLENSIGQITDALAADPASPQKEKLEETLKQFLAQQELAGKNRKQLSAALAETGIAQQVLKEQQTGADTRMFELEEHIVTQVDPALAALDQSVAALETAKLKNGTQREQIEAQYLEMFEQIDAIDAAVADNVLKNNSITEQAFSVLEQQTKIISRMDIERPNLWDATGGLIVGKIGEGITSIGEPMHELSRWLQEITVDIPVVDVVAAGLTNVALELPSGVLIGAGEMISGINMMVSHPLDTLTGMGALVGRNPQTGEWLLAGAGEAWKEMGKALISYEDFEKGRIGRGVGKLVFNIITTATGAGAGIKGAQGASIAFQVARQAGAGALKAGAKAGATGARIFAAEFTGGLAKIPGETIKGAGKLLKAPKKIGDALRLDKATRLGQQADVLSAEAQTASAQIDSMVARGDVPRQLAGRTSQELANLTPKELIEMGITDYRATRNFVRYRTALETSETAGSAVHIARVEAEASRIRMELSRAYKLDGEELDAFIERFNAEYQGLFTNDMALKVIKTTESEVLAFDEAGRLKRFTREEYDVHVAEAADFFTERTAIKRERMAGVSQKAFALSQEEWRALSVDEIFARITVDSSLSENQIRLVRSKLEQLKRDIAEADEIRQAVQDPAQAEAFLNSVFRQHMRNNNPDIRFDYPEAAEIRFGEGGIPSSIVLILDDRDFVRFAADEGQSWTTLSVEQKNLLIGKTTRGISPDIGRGNIIVIRKSVADAPVGIPLGYDYVVGHEVVHAQNKLFQIRDVSLKIDERAGQLLASGDFETYLNLDFLAALEFIRDEAVAHMIGESPLDLYERFTTGDYAKGLNGPIKTFENMAQTGQIDAATFERLSDLYVKNRRKYNGIVGNALQSAKEIAEFPQGYEMMRLTPLQDWPDLLKYLRGKQEAVETARRMEELRVISPGLEDVVHLKGTQLDEFIAGFNKNHPAGITDRSFKLLNQSEEGVVAFDAKGRLRKFDDIKEFQQEADAFILRDADFEEVEKMAGKPEAIVAAKDDYKAMRAVGDSHFANRDFEKYFAARAKSQLVFARNSIIDEVTTFGERMIFEPDALSSYIAGMNNSIEPVHDMLRAQKISGYQYQLCLELMRNFNGDIRNLVIAGLNAARGILRYQDGLGMMRVTPIEKWPDLLEHLKQTRGASQEFAKAA